VDGIGRSMRRHLSAGHRVARYRAISRMVLDDVGGLKSKRKGTGFEREVVTLARAFGIPSQRAWGSNGESLGMSKDVDLVVGEWRVQAKRRKKLPQFLRIPEGCDMVITRMDNGESLVLIHYRRFLELVTKGMASASNG
jgi:hypothetical protein